MTCCISCLLCAAALLEFPCAALLYGLERRAVASLIVCANAVGSGVVASGVSSGSSRANACGGQDKEQSRQHTLPDPRCKAALYVTRTRLRGVLRLMAVLRLLSCAVLCTPSFVGWCFFSRALLRGMCVPLQFAASLSLRCPDAVATRRSFTYCSPLHC